MRVPAWADGLDTVERILPWGCVGGLLVLGVFPFSLPLLSILIVVSLFSAMWPVGERLAPEAPFYVRPIFGLISLLAAQSILQTGWYYLGGSLRSRSDAFSLALPLVVFFLWSKLRPSVEPIEEEDSPASTWREFLKEARVAIPLLLIGEALLGAIILFAHRVATTQAINSPWSLVSGYVLTAFFGLFVLVCLAARYTKHPLITAVLSGTSLFGVSILAPLIYQLGFGFDGFLHRASELVLLTTGTLTPKPPYYLGQYVFVTWLSRVSGLDLSIIDHWLLPVAVACIPLFLLARRAQKNQRSQFVFLLVFFPLSVLTTTTPQAFAYLLGFAALLLAWDKTSPIVSVLLATWALATHPLAGLPLAAMTAGLWWIEWCHMHDWKKSFQTAGLVACGILASIGVPFAFIIHSHVSSSHIDWHTERLLQLGTWQHIAHTVIAFPAVHLALWPDWVDMLSWLTRVFLIIGIVLAVRKARTERTALLFLTLGSAGLCVAGLFLAQTGEFSFLIDYERGNYAERLFLLALLVILPVAWTGWRILWDRLVVMPHPLRIFWVVFLGVLVSGQVYNALPRSDAAIIGHGWSVGASDLEAVHFIDKDAQKQPYTVLANQSVSAAAVSQFGFKRYAGDVFYYPIPTGGPLYSLFLEATAKPALAPIQQAAQLGHSTRVYLVLNKYWWNADQVQQQFQQLADRAWSVHDGEVTIFQFNVTSTSASR